MTQPARQLKTATRPFLTQLDSPAINATLQDKPMKKKGSYYTRFEIPPDLSICELHQSATSFGFNRLDDETCCPCCNQYTKQPLAFNCPISDIYKVNQPVGFYFTFIKMMLVSLGFMVAIPGIYSIVQISRECQDSQINCDYIYGVLIPKLRAYYNEVSLLLNTIIIILQYMVVAVLFYWNVFVHEKMRLYHRKASDEHVFLTGIDHSKVSKQKLLTELQSYSVQQVIYTHKIGRYLKLFAQKYKMQALKLKMQRQGKTKKVHKINAKLRQIDNQIIPIKNKIELGDQQFLRTDKVFIKFANGYEKKRFERQFKRSILSNIFHLVCQGSRLQIQDCDIYVETLGDPREIIWQNLQVSSLKRYLLILLNNILLLCILAGSYYFVVQLNFVQTQQQANSDILLSLTLSIIIEVFNVILSAIIDLTTAKEGRYTVTGLTSAILLKKILVYFVNTTLIPFSMFVLKSFRPIQQDQMRNIFTLFIFCNIVTPIIGQCLQIGHLIKLYKRKRIRKLGKDCIQTQISANKIFQKMDFGIQERYGLLCQRMMNCVFYAAIFPVGAIVTALGLVITFFLSKYQLVNNCAIPRHSFRLGKLVTEIAALFPCLYGVGYVTNLVVYQQTPTYNILYCIIMTCISALISIIFFFFGFSFAKNHVRFSSNDISKIYVSEQVTYKDLNPTSFMTAGVNQSRDSNLSLLKNLMQYSAFREGMNFSRLSKSTLSSGLKELALDEQFTDD